MLIFASAVHVLLCIFMIFVILLQPGKDAGMGAALGGGAATSAFGGRGAVTFLGKVTAVCAIGFFVTSLGLSFVGLKSSVASGLTSMPTTATDTKKEAPKNDGPAGAMQKQDPGVANEAPKPPEPDVKGTEGVPAEKK